MAARAPTRSDRVTRAGGNGRAAEDAVTTIHRGPQLTGTVAEAAEPEAEAPEAEAPEPSDTEATSDETPEAEASSDGEEE